MARPRSLGLGLALLGTVVGAVAIGPLVAGAGPEGALDPAVAALAPPGARFEVLRLAAGYELAGERLERRGDRWRVESRRGVREVADAELASKDARSTRTFWLGSDALGRDLAARVGHGGRVSLAVAATAVALSLALGVPLGFVAGLARGRADRAVLGAIEAAQAFPRLFLLVALVAIVPAGATTTIAILGLTGWMPVARLVRAETRRLRGVEFVLAARAAGLGPVRLAARHLLPNVVAPVAIEASLAMGAAITSEAALSFLGLGVSPPTPTWGNLIADGRELVASAWWLALFPGLALVVTVVACSLIGEGLRDRLDPRGRARAGAGGFAPPPLAPPASRAPAGTAATAAAR